MACLEVMARADKDQIVAGAIESNQKMLQKLAEVVK